MLSPLCLLLPDLLVWCCDLKPRTPKIRQRSDVTSRSGNICPRAFLVWDHVALKSFLRQGLLGSLPPQIACLIRRRLLSILAFRLALWLQKQVSDSPGPGQYQAQPATRLDMLCLPQLPRSCMHSASASPRLSMDRSFPLAAAAGSPCIRSRTLA